MYKRYKLFIELQNKFKVLKMLNLNHLLVFGLIVLAIYNIVLLNTLFEHNKNIKELSEANSKLNIELSGVYNSLVVLEEKPTEPQVVEEKKLVVEHTIKNVATEIPKAPFKMKLINTLNIQGFSVSDLTQEEKSYVYKNAVGITVATNDSDIPAGSKVYIEGVGIRQVQSSARDVAQGSVLVYMTEEDKTAFGNKDLKVYLVD